jgi:hypothetical protein
MGTVQIPINEIVIDPEIMPRNQLDQAYISDLVEDLQLGMTFPPVIVFRDGDKYCVADGCHRLEAARSLGHEMITAEIREGDRPEAILYSCKANTAHGKRRTNADKHKAVKKLLQHPDWFAWSDGKIAEECAVSQPFVSNLRQDPTQNHFEPPKLRLGKDGRLINTSNIGKVAALVPPQTDPIPPPPNEKKATGAEEHLQTVKVVIPALEGQHEEEGQSDPPTIEGRITESTTPPDEKKERDVGQDEGGQEGDQQDPPAQIVRLGEQIRILTTKLEEIKNLVDGRKNNPKSAIKRMRKLRDEAERIWITLHEELEQLIPRM